MEANPQTERLYCEVCVTSLHQSPIIGNFDGEEVALVQQVEANYSSLYEKYVGDGFATHFAKLAKPQEKPNLTKNIDNIEPTIQPKSDLPLLKKSTKP
jgi:hypothetical protein